MSPSELVEEYEKLRNVARAEIADIRAKEGALYKKGAPPRFGNFAVALMLDGIASRLEIGFGFVPKPKTGFAGPRAWHVGARTQRKRGEVVTTYLVLDDNGSVVAELPEDVHSHREQSANADLICDAVNRIDLLRAFVRELAKCLEEEDAAVYKTLVGRARAAIGEAAT